MTFVIKLLKLRIEEAKIETGKDNRPIINIHRNNTPNGTGMLGGSYRR